MAEKRVFLSSPTMHGEEQMFVKEAFDTNWVAPLGKNVNEFEKEIASYVGVKDAAALVSGTSALHLAIKLCGIQQGDEVICTDLTFAATVNPVSYEKAVQVFVDSEEETWNMSPEALEKALKEHPKAKAVVVANLYGTPSKFDEITALCEKYGVTLIEDAAESLGATYKGVQTGTFGKYNAISFNGNKIITTSGGGMLLSDDTEAIQKARFWSTQSRDPAPHYQHSEIGYNYRMSNIVAGIGRGQLIHIDEHVAIKKKIYERYKKEFASLPLKMNPYIEGSMEPNFWLSCIIIDDDCDVEPYAIMDKLAEDNIESRPIWKPMHMQPVFADCDFVYVADKPVSEKIFKKGLCLPSDIKMTEEEQTRVIETVKSFF